MLRSRNARDFLSAHNSCLSALLPFAASLYRRCLPERLISAAFGVVLLLWSAQALATGAVCTQITNSCVSTADQNYQVCQVGYGNGPYCDSQFAQAMGACSAASNQCSEMFVWPKSKLLSILYMPPGNKSTVAYSSTNSSGTTDTYTQNFSTSDNTTNLSFGISGVSAAGNIAESNSIIVTNANSTSVQNMQSATWSTSGDPIDHMQDVLTIWLNPQITITNFDDPGYLNSTVQYTTGNAAYDPNSGSVVNGDAIGTDDMSAISVTVAQLQNPTTLLPSQLVSRTNSDGTVVPGLLILCPQRVPEPQCTPAEAAANACGCTAADFAFLVQQDPFFNPTIANHTIAGINAADPNDARYVPVLDSAGGNLEVPIQSGVVNNVSLTDTYNTSTTLSYGSNGSDAMTFGFNLSGTTAANFGISNTDKWTFTDTESYGKTDGTAHTQALTLATSNSSCYEYVNIYEDTVFHTFVFDNGSNAPNPCP